MEIKYEGKDKCFKNNVTLVEKLMTMCALKDLTTTICLHGLYPTLKDNIQQDHPELHQFVQAATSNDAAIITKENQEKFKRILENNNYGWDTGGMLQLTAHTNHWITKEHGASRSALSIMVLFWLISFRQNVLENLEGNIICEADKYVKCYVNHFTGGNFFPVTRGSVHKNDILRFGGTLFVSRCRFLSDLQLLNNGMTEFAHTTLEPLRNTRKQPVKIKGHTPKQMTYTSLYNFAINLHQQLTEFFSKKNTAKKKTGGNSEFTLVRV